MASKHLGYFYCLNCLHSFATENKGESHKKVCENKDFYQVVIPSEDTEILEFNQYQKPDKAPFAIYADSEFLIENMVGCKNNPENSFTTKVGQHIPSDLSILIILPFRNIENKHDVYRVKDCIKIFGES